jgi:uncharacterized protein involved in cysteine biosynthesis
MMARTVSAFLRGLASQLHPAMLALLALPFLLSLAIWAGVAWFLWDPLLDWLRAALFESNGPMRWVLEWSGRIGLESLRGMLGVVVALLLVVPLMFATAIVLIAVLAMPVVTRHLGNGPYRHVARRGAWSVWGSVWNAVSSFAIFAVGYLACLPLWLIPPLAIVVPWLWWSWLTARVMRFDSLVEHALPAERDALIARYRTDYFVLGLMVTALNYVPPLFLVTPVLSALVFLHFSLARLQEARDAAARAVPGQNGQPAPLA